MRISAWSSSVCSSDLSGFRRNFAPEFVDDYELGLKSDWHFDDVLLRTNLAFYRTSFSDIQRNLQDRTVIPPQAFIINAADATIKGIEADVSLFPSHGLNISGFFSYTFAKYGRFVDPQGTDLSNQFFALVPKYIYGLNGRYSFPPFGNDMVLSIGGSYNYQSSYAATDYFDPFVKVDSHSLVNGDRSEEHTSEL